ncbi:MAG: 30S ribosomal protein S12 methylthiotransferase RimO [Spirochaetaceae bacterium]|nr:30S ribosomal protein S12 methylthiotransferase RimO [Spirochaetaceae bacterium]
MTKYFYLDQHGCAKNQVDGEILITRLFALGWQQTDSPETAQLILINTCGFIESAKKESIEAVLEARSAYPKAKILLAGCLAERYGKDFAESFPEVDGIMGNGDLTQLDAVVADLFKDERPVVIPPQEGVCAETRSLLLNFPGSAYVKITEGCDNFCSFCAIPLIRGRLRSRSLDSVVSEIETLLADGIFEINLIGQDLAAYNPCEIEESEISPLALLLEKISALSGNFWIRLLYIHPDHFPLDILPIIQKDKRILPYFDIPFQSGSDSLILAMNRKGSAVCYQSLIATIRQQLRDSFFADVAIRTTFMCGFPGETDENAQETEKFIGAIKPDWAGCFVYSKEEDTPAYAMKKQVAKKVAKKRMESLLSLQQEITQNALARHVGKVYDVLIEEIIEDPEGVEGLAIGRSWFQAPEVDGATVIRYDLDNPREVEAMKSGNVVSVKITGSSDVDINGVYCSLVKSLSL